MDNRKYIGMDVHQASISVAVRDADGKLLMECIIETKAAIILEFIQGLCRSFWITFNDRVDARKLSDLLRAGLLTPVYHGESGVRTLQELSRSYLTITKDLTRVMNRLKGLYRSWAIPCAGQKVCSPRHRSAWLEELSESGVRRRAERLYQQLDALVELRREVRRELLAESKRHPRQRAAPADPAAGPDSGGPGDRSDPDTAPFPHKATTMGLLWAGLADAEQRRMQVHRRTTAAFQEATGAARSQRQP